VGGTTSSGETRAAAHPCESNQPCCRAYAMTRTPDASCVLRIAFALRGVRTTSTNRPHCRLVERWQVLRADAFPDLHPVDEFGAVLLGKDGERVEAAGREAGCRAWPSCIVRTGRRGCTLYSIEPVDIQ
jgi:hypothetical protein